MGHSPARRGAYGTGQLSGQDLKSGSISNSTVVPTMRRPPTVSFTGSRTSRQSRRAARPRQGPHALPKTLCRPGITRRVSPRAVPGEGLAVPGRGPGRARAGRAPAVSIFEASNPDTPHRHQPARLLRCDELTELTAGGVRLHQPRLISLGEPLPSLPHYCAVLPLPSCWHKDELLLLHLEQPHPCSCFLKQLQCNDVMYLSLINIITINI